jgi:bifunctional aspartokinase / homoserine dehydrogenase 1
MKVLKFGGTSVGSAENIRKVKAIVKSQTDDVVVVVSALGGITDKILSAARNASLGTGNFHQDLKEIKDRHEEVIHSLFNGSGAIKYIVNELLDELEQILTGITLVGELTAKTLDRIAGIGERVSSHIVSQFIGAERFDSSGLYKNRQ